MVNISWFCFVSPLAVSRRRGGGDFLPIILWEQILLNQWRQYCHHQGDKLGAEKEALSENKGNRISNNRSHFDPSNFSWICRTHVQIRDNGKWNNSKCFSLTKINTLGPSWERMWLWVVILPECQGYTADLYSILNLCSPDLTKSSIQGLPSHIRCPVTESGLWDLPREGKSCTTANGTCLSPTFNDSHSFAFFSSTAVPTVSRLDSLKFSPDPGICPNCLEFRAIEQWWRLSDWFQPGSDKTGWKWMASEACSHRCSLSCHILLNCANAHFKGCQELHLSAWKMSCSCSGYINDIRIMPHYTSAIIWWWQCHTQIQRAWERHNIYLLREGGSRFTHNIDMSFLIFYFLVGSCLCLRTPASFTISLPPT